jgi:hypothetical protein
MRIIGPGYGRRDFFPNEHLREIALWGFKPPRRFLCRRCFGALRGYARRWCGVLSPNIGVGLLWLAARLKMRADNRLLFRN